MSEPTKCACIYNGYRECVRPKEHRPPEAQTEFSSAPERLSPE